MIGYAAYYASSDVDTETSQVVYPANLLAGHSPYFIFSSTNTSVVLPSWVDIHTH